MRLRAEELNAADLEAELMPTLRRSTNLFARALGRTMVTGYEIDVEAVAAAMLRDQSTRAVLFTRRVGEGARSREERPLFRRG